MIILEKPYNISVEFVSFLAIAEKILLLLAVKDKTSFELTLSVSCFQTTVVNRFERMFNLFNCNEAYVR